MYAIDANLLVYAHNTGSPFHIQAKKFITQVMSDRDASGNLSVCLPAQVLMEFLNVITWQRLESPLPLADATQIVQDYLDTGITILYPQPTQLETLLSLLESATSRKKVFDIALVATLKDHGISGIYTANVSDFQEYAFLNVKNPL